MRLNDLDPDQKQVHHFIKGLWKAIEWKKGVSPLDWLTEGPVGGRQSKVNAGWKQSKNGRQ